MVDLGELLDWEDYDLEHLAGLTPYERARKLRNRTDPNEAYWCD